jgi:putative colanic acid biosysnthesis UDP-glucose lipid carrier transferase
MITNKRSFLYIRLFSDLLILNGSFILAAVIAQSFDLLITRSYMFALMAVLNFVWYFFSNVLNFYDDFNTKYFSFQFINIIKNTIAQAVVSVFFIFLVKEDLFTRNFILLYSGFLLLFISLRVQVLRFIVRQVMGREKNLRNLIIIGAGELGRNFHELISSHNDLGFNFIGYLDNIHDDKIDNDLLGKIERLEEVISERNIDEVVIALPIYESSQLNDIVKVCNRHAVRTHIIPDYFKFISKKFKVNILGDLPIITIRDEPLAEFHWRFIKRSFDIVFSILVIIFLLSWFIPLIYFLNLIYSPGSVIFKQDRIGADNKIFKCYKFRTMHNIQPQKFEPAVKEDPRVTKVGKFLRRSNLDELPQFLNVLKGEMSIVGPRPHPIAFNEVYRQIVDEIKLRGLVKPGITGWAQVHGFRGDVLDFEENKKRTIRRIEHDIWYIENWSFWLDLQIIMLTAWQMFRGNTGGV